MQKTKQQYINAANQFVEKIKDSGDIIGIIIAGGFLNDVIHKNSDVDIFVILKEDCYYWERGTDWINDIEIEYLMYPPHLIRKQFEREIRRPISASMLAHGTLAFQRSEEVTTIIEIAKLHLKAKLPTMGKTAIEIAKHKLGDRFKDLEDLVIVGDLFAAQLTKNEFVNHCIDLFFKYHQIKKEKFKRIKPLMEEVDERFVMLVNQCLRAEIDSLDEAKNLKSYLENLLGGKLPEKWNVRGETKPFFDLKNGKK